MDDEMRATSHGRRTVPNKANWPGQFAAGKSEARGSKSETNPKQAIRTTRMLAPAGRAVCEFVFRSFGLVSGFEIRISCFPEGAAVGPHGICPGGGKGLPGVGTAGILGLRF